ncbi:hypothetical protein BDA99DRAFT_589263 [Phascolomyces articulosus]|uniref:Uncharacterized protein n=1 Tax=Phascolomyces articulosus TaxID=60185 RepID=A0AAD5JRD0_9FUNG|nr:hypothetical protein BDA99DRAFT_589263 [Phascolomyces articulosus]
MMLLLYLYDESFISMKLLPQLVSLVVTSVENSDVLATLLPKLLALQILKFENDIAYSPSLIHTIIHLDTLKELHMHDGIEHQDRDVTHGLFNAYADKFITTTTTTSFGRNQDSDEEFFSVDCHGLSLSRQRKRQLLTFIELYGDNFIYDTHILEPLGKMKTLSTLYMCLGVKYVDDESLTVSNITEIYLRELDSITQDGLDPFKEIRKNDNYVLTTLDLNS